MIIKCPKCGAKIKIEADIKIIGVTNDWSAEFILKCKKCKSKFMLGWFPKQLKTKRLSTPTYIG